MLNDDDPNLVNPYGNPAHRRFGLGPGAAALRRSTVLLLVLVLSVALVVGTVGTSCVPPVQQDVTSAPVR